ncbi:NmrA family NAD(P)-binding protein [Streptomyces sp. CS62]|uniref:NmrA family NAD(P)-binding protein n=1 Tax=Streptomyces sp. CS62 TaxID=3119268 RepID=UPI002F949964
MPVIAVTGATGTQGGATARALLAAGHRVRALTRRPDAPAADALRRLGADVRPTDFDDRAALDAVLALTRPAEFAGRRIDIASGELTPACIAEALTAAAGRPITHREVPQAEVRRHSADLAAMFGYFTARGLAVDTARLCRDHPEVRWQGFADWAAAQDWTALLRAPADAGA